MATATLPEFLWAHHFYIELSLEGSQDNVDGIFLECAGLTCTQEVIEICEITPKKWGAAQKGMMVRTKLPGNVNSGNLTLRRCMSNSITLWNWLAAVQEGNWATQRRNFSLNIKDSASKPQIRLEFAGAWPTSYKIGDVNARNDDIGIEEIEIAFEEFDRVK